MKKNLRKLPADQEALWIAEKNERKPTQLPSPDVRLLVQRFEVGCVDFPLGILTRKLRAVYLADSYDPFS